MNKSINISNIITNILLGLLMIIPFLVNGQSIKYDRSTGDPYVDHEYVKQFILVNDFPVVTQDDLLTDDINNEVKTLVYNHGIYYVYYDKVVKTYYVYEKTDHLGMVLKPHLDDFTLNKIKRNIKRYSSS